MAEWKRRDFLKVFGLAGFGMFVGLGRSNAMEEKKSRVSLVKTEDRREGVKATIRALGFNPVKGKAVLIKPNFNTADAAPGSTHNETLAALIEELWSMGARTISLGERSYPPTREVMEQKGVLPLLKERNVMVSQKVQNKLTA